MPGKTDLFAKAIVTSQVRAAMRQFEGKIGETVDSGCD
jgi:hypothetical protein